jgi:peptidoglycan/xylan/chitin deacetylase (PgdA/CDA1 family)/WD40 repeat protein
LRKTLLLLCLTLAASFSFGQVSFSGLDLSPSDRLLFTASAASSDTAAFDTLFLADPHTRHIRQLTFYPEEVQLLQDKDVLQIQNRFGVFRSETEFGNIAPIAMFPSFVAGSQVQSGTIAPMQTSPDGRYLLYLRTRSPAYGDLTLLNVSTGSQVVISSKIELSLAALPAAWSPDSRFIVYAKASGLYYFSLAQLQDNRVLTEDLRNVGSGSMANVKWVGAGTLDYISGVIVYQIDPNELFTRALYTGFLKIGTVVAKIPFQFDPNFDSFWVSPDGKNLLLNKGGRNVFLYYITLDDFHASGVPLSLPYLSLPRDTTVRKVIWSVGNVVTMLCETRNGGVRGTAVFRLTQDAQGAYGSFVRTDDKDVRDLALSPDGTRVALMTADGVTWKDYGTWEDKGKLAHPSPLHVLWLGDDELLVAGMFFIERFSLGTSTSTLVALSQPGESGHARDSDTVLARLKDRVFSFDETAGAWKAADTWSVRDKGAASDNYRVYLEPSARGSYANRVMIRDAKGFGTMALFPPETVIYEPFPTGDEPVDFTNFSHGSRIRRREVSLVFNAVDSAEGLTGILNTLSAYHVRATFFVNGEFIRRYPDAVREIADSGHEVGSLFYAYFNMTDARFTVDKDFVKSGLARNEDDYYTATGRELSLLWHAPYYIVNSGILSAAAEMNYVYAGRDLDSYDWVTATESNQARGIYMRAADLVERIVAQKRPGSIIPLQVGAGEGRRDDYLFQKLDILINELVGRGYDIVPASTLMEDAR